VAHGGQQGSGRIRGRFRGRHNPLFLLVNGAHPYCAVHLGHSPDTVNTCR